VSPVTATPTLGFLSSSFLLMPEDRSLRSQPDAILVLLPLLIILSTFLFLLLTFLICVVIVRRRRGIILRDNDGPIDMSREELIESDGGFENLEFRWLDEVDDSTRRNYLRAKGTVLPCELRTPSYRLPLLQNTSCNTLRTHFQPISPYPNFSPYRKRGFQLGRLNRISIPSTPSLSRLAPKLLSYQTQLLHLVFSLIYHYPNLTKFIIGK
jgi:hypothetical protein